MSLGTSNSIPFLFILAAILQGAERRPAAAVPVPLAWPDDGSSVQVRFVQSIATPEDAGFRRSLLARLGDVVAGPSERPRRLIRPFHVCGNPTGRFAVTDPGAGAAHLVDRGKKRYRILRGPSRQALRSPVACDFDEAGNLYVTDSELGKIFVFNREGSFARFIGDARGEGIYKRPTGLVIDRAAREIYLTDTLRHKVHVIDYHGKALREWGGRGDKAGEFNYPSAVALNGETVFVLDAMNFRIQAFSRAGEFRLEFGKPANEPGGFFRPKGLCFDRAAGLIYVVDAMFEAVQAFTPEGRLVFAFGYGGSAPGEFRLPAGVAATDDGRLLVADSYNGRIQIFEVSPPRPAGGSQ